MLMRKLLCLALFAAFPAFACITISQQPQPASAAPGSGPASIATRVEATAPSAIRYQWYEGDRGDTSRPFIGATSAEFCPPPPAGSRSHCSWGKLPYSVAVWVRLEADCGTADSDYAVVRVLWTHYDGMQDVYVKTSAPGWRVIEAADFNGDTHPDLALFNEASRQIVIWRMVDQAVVATEEFVDRLVAPSWAPVAIADFDGDSDPDIVMRGDYNLIAVWTMNGRSVASTENFIGWASPGWSIAGAADFDRDGDPDLLLVNMEKTVIWELDGFAVAGTENFLPRRNAQIGGTGDFNGDGWTDLVLALAHGCAVWRMEKFTVLNTESSLGYPYPYVMLPLTAADFDRSGVFDVLVRYPADRPPIPGETHRILVDPPWTWRP